MHAKRISSTAGIVVIVACIIVAAPSHSVPNALFGGTAAFDSFRSSERVTVARLHRKPIETWHNDPTIPKLPDEPSSALHILPFYRSDTPAPVGANDVRTLKQILSDPRSYTWHAEEGIAKLCMPDYAVMFTFYSASAPVRILLCFHCDQMAVLVGKGDDPLRVNSEEDFDYIRSPLLTLVKRLFPNDSDIQALPLQRQT